MAEYNKLFCYKTVFCTLIKQKQLDCQAVFCFFDSTTKKIRAQEIANSDIKGGQQGKKKKKEEAQLRNRKIPRK